MRITDDGDEIINCKNPQIKSTRFTRRGSKWVKKCRV